MIACDIADAEQVNGMMNKVLTDFGRIDILINNAGIGMRKPFVDTPVETIEAILRTNYLGAVYCTHAALPAMIARRSGHIVNISSGAGKIGTLNMAGYCASKFAMNGWSESLYHELIPLGVNVSLICPGPVSTQFSHAFEDSEPKSPPQLFINAAAVSHAVMRAIEKNQVEVVMPRLARTYVQRSNVSCQVYSAYSHSAVFAPMLEYQLESRFREDFPGN
jgi:short-subunit dehydrogenase